MKMNYGRISQISSTSRLQKGLDKTVQIQIILLLKKQSDQGLPCLLFWHALCEFHPRLPTFILEQREKKCSKFKNIYHNTEVYLFSNKWSIL